MTPRWFGRFCAKLAATATPTHVLLICWAATASCSRGSSVSVAADRGEIPCISSLASTRSALTGLLAWAPVSG